MKVSVVNSACGSFCWNDVTDAFYVAILQVIKSVAVIQVRGSIAIMQVVLSVIVMLVDLSVAIMQVTVSVAIIQLEVSAAFSTLHHAHDCFILIVQAAVSVMAIKVIVSSNNFIFLSLTNTHF